MLTVPVTGYANNGLCLQTQGERKKKANVQPRAVTARAMSLDSILTIEACPAAPTKTACHQKVSRTRMAVCTCVFATCRLCCGHVLPLFSVMHTSAFPPPPKAVALVRPTSACLDWCLCVILAVSQYGCNDLSDAKQLFHHYLQSHL